MSGQQGGDDKHSMGILWGIAGVFILGAAIWWGFSEQIKQLFVALRYYELHAIWLVVQFIPFDFIREDVREAIEIVNYLHQPGNYVSLNGSLAQFLSEVSGKFLRIPLGIGVLWFAYVVYSKNVVARYRKRYDMASLANQEIAEWPQIKAVDGLNLVNAPLNEGPWAMAHGPVAFCKMNDLITIKAKPPTALGKGPTFEIELDKVKANKVFTNQLGKMWDDPEKLPDYKRFILSVCVGRGCRDSQAAKDLVHKVNASCDPKNPGKLDFSGADALWKKHYGSREIQEIVSIHAYENTLFTDLLLFARQDGVLPTSDFLWIKPVDRLFWYVLNNVGRQTPCSEAAGAHAHFLAEKSLRRPLTVPMVEEATKALQMALDEIIYVPESTEEKEQLLKEAFGE